MGLDLSDIVGILDVSRSLQKTMQQGGGDSNKFRRQNVQKNAQSF